MQMQQTITEKSLQKKETLTPKHPNFNKVKQYLSSGGSVDNVYEKYTVSDTAMSQLINT